MRLARFGHRHVDRQHSVGDRRRHRVGVQPLGDSESPLEFPVPALDPVPLGALAVELGVPALSANGEDVARELDLEAVGIQPGVRGSFVPTSFRFRPQLLEPGGPHVHM